MTSITPKPWIRRYTATQDGHGGSSEFSVVHYKERGDEYVCRNVRSEGDAGLIAAAPFLLESAEAYVNMLVGKYGPCYHCPELDALRSAIKTAKGEN